MLSVLVVAPTFIRSDRTTCLLELAAGMSARGHRVRLVTTTDAASQTLRGIYRALSAEPTHIIHTASLRATYAAALASFAFTLRHPCAPEPAIVTSLDENDSPTLVRRLLPGDCVIVASERARDALMSGGRQYLGGRVQVIVPGHDPGALATLAVYHLAWERRQRENRQALLAFEA